MRAGSDRGSTRGGTPRAGAPHGLSTAAFALIAALALGVAGCSSASTTVPTTASVRGDAASPGGVASSSGAATGASTGGAHGTAPSGTPSATTSTPPGPAFGAALTPVQFVAALQSTKAVVLDVRTPAEYATGHLPGTVNVPFGPSFGAAIASYDRARPYALYCQTGNRSAQALQQMKEMGFTQAFHLGGGIVAWRQAGGQIVK